MPLKSKSILESNRTTNYDSNQDDSNRVAHDCSMLNVLNDQMYRPKGLRNFVTHQLSKTPMQHIQNPLKAYNFTETCSQRDDLSDQSDDDLFFIDEYFRSAIISADDTIYLAKTNAYA